MAKEIGVFCYETENTKKNHKDYKSYLNELRKSNCRLCQRSSHPDDFKEEYVTYTLTWSVSLSTCTGLWEIDHPVIVPGDDDPFEGF